MSRPPLSPASAGLATPPASGARPGLPPMRPPAREPGERRTLVVGRGISVQGTVQDAERLVVEGTVEASMIHATELAIAPGGIFKGEVEVEEAEIAGTIDGTLTARGALVVRSTGRVLGTARCRRLQVEDGGQITGHIEMITDQAKSDLPAPDGHRTGCVTRCHTPSPLEGEGWGEGVQAADWCGEAPLSPTLPSRGEGVHRSWGDFYPQVMQTPPTRKHEGET